VVGGGGQAGKEGRRRVRAGGGGVGGTHSATPAARDVTEDEENRGMFAMNNFPSA